MNAVVNRINKKAAMPLRRNLMIFIGFMFFDFLIFTINEKLAAVLSEYFISHLNTKKDRSPFQKKLENSNSSIFIFSVFPPSNKLLMNVNVIIFSFAIISLIAKDISGQYLEPPGPLFDEGMEVPEELIETGYYVKKNYSHQNRIDTLKSPFHMFFQIDTIVKGSGNHSLFFYESDQLLVIENLDTNEKNFYFLEFTFEEGSCSFHSKNFLTKNGVNIQIEYELNKTIFQISIYDYSKINYLSSYYKRSFY